MLFFSQQQVLKKIDYDIPWIEKYRPKKVSDMVGQDAIISSLKRSLTEGGFPNLLFYGPSGVGKTSAIISVAKELFGNQYENRVMELNATKERGIRIIRNKIKTFAKFAVNQNHNTDGIPNIKLIILDESDNITNDAQSALRRSMEMYCSNTRFCIICNYISKIIDPITSRCSMYKFSKLKKKEFIYKLETICNAENVIYQNEVLSKIYSYSNGDLRKGISLLDYSAIISEKNIKYEDLSLIIGNFQISNFQLLLNNELSEKQIFQFTFEIIKKGYCCRKIIKLFLKEIINSDLFDDTKKLTIIDDICYSEKHIIKGSSPFLSLLNIFLNFSKK
jgi:replication factor C subunit 2/4